MHLDKNQIQQIQTILNNPTLQFAFSESFGSNNKGYKELLRDQLVERINSIRKLSEYEKIELQNIYKVPNIPGFYISISHSEGLGGFAISKTKAIGFDIEKKSRISKEVIQRVCNTEEIKKALKPESLWGAKESTFKALQYFHQPEVVSAVKIDSWVLDTESQFEIFSLQNNLEFSAPSGNGCIIRDNNYIYSIFSF